MVIFLTFVNTYNILFSIFSALIWYISSMVFFGLDCVLSALSKSQAVDQCLTLRYILLLVYIISFLRSAEVLLVIFLTNVNTNCLLFLYPALIWYNSSMVGFIPVCVVPSLSNSQAVNGVGLCCCGSGGVLLLLILGVCVSSFILFCFIHLKYFCFY